MGDHVHMLTSIPPKYAVSQVVGYVKGKSAIHIARTYAGCRRNFVDQNFWARGYYVSTVGRDEETIRIHQKAGRGGSEDRSAKLILKTATFRWLMVFYRFERFTKQASGFAGGR